MAKQAASAGEDLKTSASRRGFIGKCVAVPAAVAAGGSVATNAAAAIAGHKLSTFKGRYAVDGHRIVDGYFASPRGKANLDVVVVVSESGKLDAAAEAAARNYAASGWMAIAPDLPATYRTASLGGKAAMVEALTSDLPRLKRLGRASGTVRIVSA